MFGCIMKIVIENVFMVWLHFENAIFLLVSHTFSSIFSASKQILYKKIHFHPHTSIHRKSTTTHTPEPTKIHHYPHKTYHHTTQKPSKHHHPHHHNNKKNQNLSFQPIMVKVWNKLVHIDLPIFSLGDKKSTDKFFFLENLIKKKKR